MERFNIGVDLHKTQFTICCLSGESFLWEGQYSTNPGGYAEFKRRILGLSKRSKKSSVYLAVESTGNTKFSRTQLRHGDVKFTWSIHSSSRSSMNL
jgi:hypothetical protein